MKTTPLHATHVAANAKMGEFAGYDMPLFYPEGVIKEHDWVRNHAGIFDVSHMGQILLFGQGVAKLLERLTPSAFQNAKPCVAKYTVMTNEHGGIVDDLIVTRLAQDVFFAVINAGCKEKDIGWIASQLPPEIELHELKERSLIALQGPKSEAVMKAVFGVDLSTLGYMRMEEMRLDNTDVYVSRLGYTGEDGFEISVPISRANDIWTHLSHHADVKPIGLAARDSLRLEMGYCLYGHDINDSTTPLEADLGWVMSPENTKYIGASEVVPPLVKRVGVKLTGAGIAREKAEIRNDANQMIGFLTSGGFSPTLLKSIGQGYVDFRYTEPGTKVMVNVRDRNIDAVIEPMPFVPQKTKATKKAV